MINSLWFNRILIQRAFFEFFSLLYAAKKNKLNISYYNCHLSSASTILTLSEFMYAYIIAHRICLWLKLLAARLACVAGSCVRAGNLI